jgi:hypothetical protein
MRTVGAPTEIDDEVGVALVGTDYVECHGSRCASRK